MTPEEKKIVFERWLNMPDDYKTFEDFITQLLKARSKEYEDKLNSLLLTRQEKMVDIINRLEIVATREDNPTHKEKAELVKEIWELWIKPVIISNLTKENE